MENERKELPDEEDKPRWQKTKEGWYDKLNVSVRTLDFIIWGGIGALIVVFIKIFMDAGIL